jgi:hypothetical protein
MGTLPASTGITTAAGDELAATFSNFARRYSELGWALVRLHGKVPKGQGWQKTQSDADPERAAGLWAEWGQRWNIGIVLGPSGLAVVEFDSDEGGRKLLELFGGKPPLTPTVRTGRNRLHFFFAAPEQRQKAASDGIELGLGPHQCAAPPSVHPDTGRRYRWLAGREPWNLPLGEVPQAVLDYLETRPNGGSQTPLPETIAIGEIDRTLASLAGSMRRRDASEEAIYAALLATLPRCAPGHTHTEADCRRIVRSYARYPAEPSNGQQQGGRLHLVRIRDVAARRVQWIEEGLIPRAMVTGLVAPGGTVKGLYGVHLAAKLAARGERSLFLCSEDALAFIVRPRFQAAGCDGALALALELELEDGTHRNLRFPSELPLLREAIVEVEPTLVVVDPIASYLDPGLDMAKNNQMRDVLQPLISLAGEFEIAIVPVYHLGKDRGRGALGSVAFEDACRCVLTAARDDEDEDVRHIELTKSNVGPTGYGRKLRIVEVPLELDGATVEVAKLVDEGRSGKSVPRLLARKEPPGPDPTQRQSARERVCELLIEAGVESISAGETRRRVADELGVSSSTVWRAFVELKDEGLAAAAPVKDEHGTILEWRWHAKPALLLERGDG